MSPKERHETWRDTCKEVTWWKGWADNDNKWGDFDPEIYDYLYSLDVCL